MKVKRRPPNQQIGTPMDLYDHPANLFVAIFLGVANVVTGNIAAEDGRMIFRSSDGAVVVPAAESARESNSIIFRPQNLTIGITCL
jgi:iron(III) transport system ATP-binding protein